MACFSSHAQKNNFLILFALFVFLIVLSTLKTGFHLSTGSFTSVNDTHTPLELSPRNGEGEGEEFWKQPDGMGYRPCMEFSKSYVEESMAIVSDRRKYLMVMVTGGLNQQRSQTIDAVVIARILRAALVVPILSVNVVWKDEAEFSDVFDEEHFKIVLKEDVRVVSNLPPNYWGMVRPVERTNAIPFGATVDFVRSKLLNLMNSRHVILLRAFDSRLSKDLPDDLQKLRCKVAFQALRFRARILQLGNMLAARMRSKDHRYLAIHLRVEKDVWLRSGCLPGLTSELDEAIERERPSYPNLLSSRTNMSNHERKLAGHCPLTVLEVTRLLKALRCPRNARIYLAGAEPYGGREVAFAPLVKDFPFVCTKEDVALPGELDDFAGRPSLLAAIDFVVAESSDVFLQSHGGNMGRTIQGHRAYNGHRKHVTPNKRSMVPYFLNASLDERGFDRIVEELHRDTSLGKPHLKLEGKDVTAHPIPSCMCNNTSFPNIISKKR